MDVGNAVCEKSGMSVASRVFRVQKGEGSVVALVVGLMFVFMASGTIGESGIDALFFDHLGAQALRSCTCCRAA